jgi:hypothetical protein
MTFALDLQKFAAKAGKRADDAVANIVVRVATELDKRSPVGDATYWQNPAPRGYIGGHFRANWQLGVGVMPRGERAGVDPNGTVALPGIIAEIPAQASGKVYFLANTAPYANRLENGWSRQAPAGLVGLTATMFQQIVRQAVAELP